MKFTKLLVKTICFISIFIILFSNCSKILSYKWDEYPRTISFYKLPKDSIDVIILGSSTFDLGISPLLMWEDFGFTSYVRAIPGQEIIVTYYYLLETLNYQTPKLVVLDAYRLFSYDKYDDNETSYQRSIEILKFSWIKICLTTKVALESDLSAFLSLLFPFFRYHSRWTELEIKDFNYYRINRYDPYRGQRISFESTDITYPENFLNSTTKRAGFNNESLFYYEKIVELCNKENINLMLLAFPRSSWANYSQHLAIEKFADEQNLIFIDYNLPNLMNDANFDPSTDFKNKNHLNTFGAKKFAYPIGSVIVQNYNILDKRTDPNYQQWNQDAKHLKDLISENRITFLTPADSNPLLMNY